jgi:diguanylate cyclase (GGDEF)-like protein/PAS domain S-box-containing protein
VKRARLVAAAGGAVVAVAFIGVLAWQARTIDPAAHSRVLANLSRLQELDSELDETVLKLRDALLNTYDPLVAKVSLVHAHRRDLQQGEHAIARVGGAELDSAMGQVAGELAAKELLLEQFKSNNALLRNSVHYFPPSVETLMREPQLPEGMRRSVRGLLRDVLMLRLGPTPTDYELIGLQIDQLRSQPELPAASGAREKLQLVLLHGENVLRHQASVDRLVAQITGPAVKRTTQSLADAYNSAFERKLREANVYRLLLLLASAALLTYGASAFLRLRRALGEQAQSEERYRNLFELSPDGMLIHAEGRIILVNSMCMKLLGADKPEQLVGRPVIEIFHPDYHERIRQRMDERRYDSRPAPAEERKIVTLGGATLEIEVAASRLMHRGKPSVQVVMRDITERKRADERLNYMAQYDALTGLPNRSLFRDRLAHGLSQARRSGRPAAVLFIDLDRFKIVNDTLGHAIGDKLLQEAAARLKECVRSGDTVGRFGGDEFAMILLDLAKPGDAGLVAQKVNDILARPFDLDGNRTFVSASIGITLYPTDATDPETLSMNADAAMYRAKEKGRNNYQFFTPEMNERAVQRMQMETAMRRALERGEFLLHYQPKTDVASGAICGAEALLRWAHPERGLVSPAEFIPVLEETGLIVPVGEWVMREACRQIAAWQRAGLKVPPVAVNLSARQFQQKNLEQTIHDAIREGGIDPALLQFEITESLLMNDPQEAERTLRALKQAGVKLSIDDFGTGYSSLAYLRRFPLDALKIDRAFVKDIVANADDAAITLAVISLAHSLGLKVVAEGVETEAQLNLLALHSCDEMQGYYFSRPVAPAALEAMVREGRRLTRSQDWGQAKPAVLLLDDSEEYLVLLERALRSEEFEVLSATTAEKAFALLAGRPVGVVVSDQRMPGMDGAEFLSKVRKLYPNALRVAITGAPDPEVIADAVNDAGIHKFLSKTWDDERLRAEVREAYRHAAGAAPKGGAAG